MAHELDFSRGDAAFFEAMVPGVSPAWHGLGVKLPARVTAAEAVRAAKLDYRVEQVAISTPTGAVCPEHVANVRTDTGAVLGVVTSGYRVFQNADALGFLDPVIGEGQAVWETAGALKGGKRIFALAKLPERFEVVGDDWIDPYLLVATSHDGSLALSIIPTKIRVVCWNTLTAALWSHDSKRAHARRAGKRRPAGFSIRHTASMNEKVRAAQSAIANCLRDTEAFAKQAQQMAARVLEVNELRAYWNCLFPTQPGSDGASLRPYLGQVSSVVAAALEPFAPVDDVTLKSAEMNREHYAVVRDNFANPRQTIPGIRGSVWAAFNAVTEYVDHQKKGRGRTYTDRVGNRVESVLWGSGAELKDRAYQAAVALASC